MSTSRSQSQYAFQQLNSENQELIERNRNLELKLRYVQSVNTIFRQRVGVLLQTLTTKLAEVQINNNPIDLTSMLNTVNDSASLVRYQQHVDAYATNNNDIQQHRSSLLHSSSPSSSTFSQSEVAYWQDRFIDAMSNIQPISQSEVETLCRLIREKVDRDALIHQKDRQIQSLQNQVSPPRDGSGRTIGASSPSHSYADDVADEVTALRQQLQTAEARCKSLHHRLTEMRKREQEAEAQKSTHNLDLTSEVGTLSVTVRELRARLAEHEGLNRRLTTEVNALRSDKNLQLQHLSRMQGMCAAVMRESQCAVNEGLAATQMNESALLKRQLDTFELVLRKTEQDLTQSKRQLEERENQLAEKEREVQSLQLRLESKEKTMELYRTRCERMATQEKEQREEHAKAMQLLKSRLGDAVGELETAFTTKEIGAGLQKMTTSAEKISLLASQLTDMQKKYSTLRSCFAVLSEELTLAAKQGRPPNTETVTAEESRVLITRDDSSSAEDNNNVIIKIPREKVLRTEGHWKEVRDLNEGSVFYVSSKIDGTPFDPVPADQKPPPSPKQQQQQSSSPSPNQNQSPSPSPSRSPANVVITPSSPTEGNDNASGDNNTNSNKEPSPETDANSAGENNDDSNNNNNNKEKSASPENVATPTTTTEGEKDEKKEEGQAEGGDKKSEEEA